jgi:hypothetical protein
MLLAFSQCWSAADNAFARFRNVFGVFPMFLEVLVWKNLQNIEEMPHSGAGDSQRRVWHLAGGLPSEAEWV